MPHRANTVSLRSRLSLIAAAGMLPLAVGAGVGLGMAVHDQWRAAEARSLEVVGLTASAIETEIQRTFAALNVTAASPLIDANNLVKQRLLLERVMEQMGDWRGLVLSTPEGRPVAWAGEAPVESLPGIADSQSLAHVVRLRTPVLGDMAQNARREWGIPVRVAVERAGRLRFVLTAILKPDVFYKIIKAQPFPTDWIMSVFDRRGIRVARSRDNQEMQGKPASPQLWSFVESEKRAGISRTPEGTQVMSGVVRLESGWIAGIGIPTSGVWGGIRQAGILYTMGAAFSLLLGFYLASFVARRINQPISQLSASAEMIGRGSLPPLPDTRIHELANLGRALRAAAQAREVIESDRKAALAEADELERRLGIALDSSTVPFSILSPVRDDNGVVVDFRWEYLNRAAAVDIRHEAADLIGQTIGRAAPQLWKIPGLFESFVRVAEGDKPAELEVTAADGAAPERTLQIVVTPMRGTLAVWSADVTLRKQGELALQAADRRKDEFLAILAHELRNPLAPIQQAAMISSMPQVTEAQKRWSQDVIARQVKHMALLLEDLLDISRITRGKLELRRTRLELREAVDAGIETARPHLEDKSHRLTVELPPEPVYLDADTLRIAQVVTNLLTNAARYTDPGGEIRLRVEDAGRGRVAILVEDTGMGIAPEHIETIFEMFSQGAHRAAQGGGLGIGLALARGIAQLHGGTLTASSPGPGKGSRFTLILPTAAQLGAPVVEPARLAKDPAPARRILVADDNRDAADTLVSLLRLAGHIVWVTYEGNGALREYEARNPDVVLLDIGMPSMSGYEVARRIRRARPKDPPLLIALTGWGQVKDKAHAAGAGFDHHLTKPVDVQALFRLLRGQPALRSPAANE